MYIITNRRRLLVDPSPLLPYDGMFGKRAGRSLSYLEAPGLKSYVARVKPSAMLEDLRSCEDPTAVVFIHGFNVDWRQAQRFFCELDVGLEDCGFTVGFSWASTGRVTHYLGDRAAARASAVDLAQLLVGTAGAVQARCSTPLVVVAHSMGAYVLSKAATYAREAGLGGSQIFRDVLLVAPDLDGGAFRPGGVSEDLAAMSRRVTVYRSIHDPALAASTAKRAGLTGRRLGRQGPDRRGELPDNVVVVDVSDHVQSKDAHSEHFRNTAVTADMRAVIAGEDRSAIAGRVPCGAEFKVVVEPRRGEMFTEVSGRDE